MDQSNTLTIKKKNAQPDTAPWSWARWKPSPPFDETFCQIIEYYWEAEKY